MIPYPFPLNSGINCTAHWVASALATDTEYDIYTCTLPLHGVDGHCCSTSLFSGPRLWLPQPLRFGEASHPGPEYHEELPFFENCIMVSQSNISSLRSKELHVAALGPGIHCFSETHMTSMTLSTFSKGLRRVGQQQHRAIKTLAGSPAPLRTGSNWAGDWSGVAQCSDYCMAPIRLSWSTEQWLSSRIMLARHQVPGLPLSVATIYGFAKGPTWPNAADMTNDLLIPFTKDYVIGCQGPRLITGDFNVSYDQLLPQQRVWLTYGWQSAQSFAIQHLGHEWQPTNGQYSEIDQIWLSPEAQQLLRHVSVAQVFAGHKTVAAYLHLPTTKLSYQCWPLPSALPWQHLEDWQPPEDAPLPTMPADDSTAALAQWGRHLEAHFSVQANAANVLIPPNALGRVQRLAPETREIATPVCKKPRDGELGLSFDLLGHAVKRWYDQAKRIQSLLHNLRAARDLVTSHLYRIEVWTAILRAKGFDPDFRTWWCTRTSHNPDACFELPASVPHLEQAELIYLEFVSHFRAFERWHQNQRSERLELRYQGTMRALFQDLKPAKTDTVTFFTTEMQYEVLDSEDQQVHLDAPADTTENSLWWIDDEDGTRAITPFDFDGVVCKVPITQVAVGTTLTQRIFCTDHLDVCQKLVQHWKGRWQATVDTSRERLQQVFAFCLAFLPKLQFELQPLTLHDWKRAIRKMKKTAATGPDGVSRHDFVHMPQVYLQWIVDLFNSLELGTMNWPHQFLTGLITCVAKVCSPTQPGDFRPIHVFAVAYRLWGSMRTKQLLSQLVKFLPPEIHGFVPGQETSQIWMLIQGWVEASITCGFSWHGISADVRRCFNNIEREPTFAVGMHVGLPERILSPWAQFLVHFERRFQIHHGVSEPVTSNRGYPEGCPLSIVAMILVNWGHHEFLRCYFPKVELRSFVDNLDLHGPDWHELHRAFVHTNECLALWGLELDDDKTFGWSTHTGARQLIKQAGFRCLLDARELGGSMAFCRAVRNKQLKDRGDNLHPKWQRLSRSRAPLTQKLKALPIVFWTAALHGSAACVIADGYIQQLRVLAIQSLGLRCAGANAILRLTLLDDMDQDPGYYHIRLTLHTMRRMLHKCSELIQLWKLCWHRATGHVQPGPFTKVNLIFNQLGWSLLEPPFFFDHLGCPHDLGCIDRRTLDLVLQDAWLQFISTQVRHKTMGGLCGLNQHLTSVVHRKLTTQDTLRLSALQCGSFLTAAQQSKFDGSKSLHCEVCQQQDTRKHWLQCPHYQDIREELHLDVASVLSLPDCAVNHLLFPQLTVAKSFRVSLSVIHDSTCDFLSCCATPDTQHIFVDGSCQALDDSVSLAAWGVINATTGDIVSSGLVPGWRQTADRAEITSVISALEWGNATNSGICVWSDCLHVAMYLQQLTQETDFTRLETNADLWCTVEALLRERVHLETTVRWIPSHLQEQMMEDPFESWVCRWNSLADQLAVSQNQHRGDLASKLAKQLVAEHQVIGELAVRLRDFYLKVADRRQQAPRTSDPQLRPVVVPSVGVDCGFSEFLPLGWKSQILDAKLSEAHLLFQCSMIEQLQIWDLEENTPLDWYTDVELAVALLGLSGFCFPVSIGDRFESRSVESLPFRIPLNRVVRPVDECLSRLVSLFDLGAFRRRGIRKPELRILMGRTAFVLRMPLDVRDTARTRILKAAAARPFRSSQELARPV